MYLFLAFLATFSYALQNVLSAYYYRKFPPILVTALRGLSLGITMLPLLLLVEPGRFSSIKENYITLFLAAFFAALGNIFAGKSYSYISVGLASAFQQSMFLLGVCVASIFMFGEQLQLIQIICIVFLVFGIYLSSVGGKGLSFQFDQNTLKGLFYSLLFGLLETVGFTNVSKLSRATDPFLAAYFWEFTIGLFGLLFYIIVNKFDFRKETTLKFRDFSSLMIAVSPTVIGTGCFAVAATLGPISIISAILSGVVVFSSLFAYWFYKEKLTVKQISGMIIVVVSVILINLFSS